MPVLRTKIGPLDIAVQSDDSEFLAVANHALPRNGPATSPKISIEIHKNPSIELNDVGAHIQDGQVFALNHVTYRFCPDPGVCWALVGEEALGLIDYGKSKTVWQVKHLPPPNRSSFHLYVLDPLSLLLPELGLLVCHGAAVVTEHGATLILGSSKSGKSSLSFLASHMGTSEGIRFLSDDTFVLDFDSSTIQVYPVNTGFGLSSKLLDEVSVRDRHIIQVGQGKVYLSRVPNQAKGPHRVAQMVFLSKQTEDILGTEVLTMNREKTLRALVNSQTTIGSPYLIERLNLFRRLACQISGVTLRYSKYCDVNVLRKILNEEIGT